TSPGDVLTRVNRELVQGNEASMFVTVFLGILDLRSGMLHFANGGHNDPFLIRQAEPVRPIKGPRGLLVGAMEEATYVTGEFLLLPGDRIYLYTDGVTEATNAMQNLFCEDRLRKCLELLTDSSIQEILDSLKMELDVFEQGTPQSDDITMLVVQFNKHL
ncbi:MAG: serine/threonine-protein phosphatase, partial [Desulfobacteraceae bacterium]